MSPEGESSWQTTGRSASGPYGLPQMPTPADIEKFVNVTSAFGELNRMLRFVADRLDEDEAAANAGARRVGVSWRAERQLGTPGGLVTDDIGLVGSTGGLYAAEHIARHDPARVLRQVSVLRTLIAGLSYSVLASPGGQLDVGVLIGFSELASIWADHPDYDRTWKERW
jgi:Family of unknown function (DUF6221)